MKDKSHREMLNEFMKALDEIAEDWRKHQFEKQLKQTLKENKIDEATGIKDR